MFNTSRCGVKVKCFACRAQVFALHVKTAMPRFQYNNFCRAGVSQMLICACMVCSWFSVAHLWAQDMFWGFMLVVFKILCILKKVSKGVALLVVKEALRKCV